jgi:hypothetical protein
MCILKEEESGQESGTSDHVWNILGIISSIADFLAVGLGASAVTMVWVPIPVYSEIKDGREVATKELKTCYLIVCFMEKVAIIFVLAALFRFGQAILEMGEEDMK